MSTITEKMEIKRVMLLGSSIIIQVEKCYSKLTDNLEMQLVIICRLLKKQQQQHRGGAKSLKDLKQNDD